ncbi:MAG: LysE family translocator [bacterium]|jgi:threonine/homoserine/homoserine lactone efflux protein
MDIIISAVFLGVTSAVSPGPLLMLIIAETMKYGIRAGIKVCFAPLITDGPVILISFLIFSRLTQLNLLLGIISILGALYLVYIGYESVSFQGAEVQIPETASRSLRKGIFTNILSPSPYMFWLSIGTPIILGAWQRDALLALLFVIIFFALLVGIKIILTVLIGKGRNFLNTRAYIHTNRFLGILLWFYAAWFIWKAVGYFQ